MEKIMVGSNLMEEIDCGSFFDHIDDLLEFPNDILDADFAGGVGGNSDAFNGILPNSSPENLPGSDPVFSGYSTSDFSAELSVPYEDIVQLEWLSTFVEDSFSGGGTTMVMPHASCSSFPTDPSNSHHQFRTSSPVSVLESSSSCSNNNNNNAGDGGGSNTTIPLSHEKRARTKRPRPAKFSPRRAIHLIPTPSSSLAELADPRVVVPCSSSESATTTTATGSRPSNKGLKRLVSGDQQLKKKKKIKIVPPSSNSEESDRNQDGDPYPSAPVRKCRHCEITKTPQWRAGPMGPKTLCNACGVRYKSGRLFPEYRPAASPTFVPALHSNSHKKVLEMRSKISGPEKAISCGPGLISNAVTALGTASGHQAELLMSTSDLTTMSSERRAIV